MRLPQFARLLERLGRPRASSQARIPVLERLEDRRLLAGRGLAGYYFAGTDFTQVKLKREDAQVNFAWQGSPDASIPAGGFGARWSGRVMPKYSETCNFYTRTTGGVRLWVNNNLIINDWSVHPLKDNKGSITLLGGVRYDIRLEYFDTSSDPFVQLQWASKRQGREVVPQNRLFASELDTTKPTAPSHLKATYITDSAFKFVWNSATDDSGAIVYETYIGKTRLGATSATYYTRGGRSPQTSYNVTVRAVDFAGNVSISQPLTITTMPPFADGGGSGVAGAYFASPDLSQFRLTRTDPRIAFPSQQRSDAPSGDPLSARWEGSLLAKYDELYTFTIASDGGVRLWIGGQLLIDHWDQQGAAQHTATMKLRAAQTYSLKLEYRHAAGEASITASWSSLSTKPAIIPASQLAPAFEDTSAPSPPSDPRLNSASESSISMSWDAATDDVGVVYYDVYRDGNLVGSTFDTSFTESDLDSDTSYSYTVVAIDGAARLSVPSSALSARTSAPAPRDALAIIAAGNYGSSSGVTRSGNAITSLDDGDWVKFGNLDFGSAGVDSWRVRLGVPVANVGGWIELRLGSPDGTLIGSQTIQATGGYGTYFWQQASVSNITGMHDLYLVFRGQSGVANIESFQFSTKQLVRIMALGDSITTSNPGHNSYRYYLWHDLLNNGYGANFVGSQTRNDAGPPNNLDFDQDHEGHSGLRADELLPNVGSWVTDAQPDIVLIHLGTNDLMEGQSVSSTITDIGLIIDATRAVNPAIRIVVAKILPAVGFDALVDQFNSELVNLVASMALPGSPLVLADMNSGFSSSTDQYDGIHPNGIGESKMADRWYVALVPLLA